MYIITNRVLDESKTNLKLFGKTPNHNGPLELRIVDVNRKGKQWVSKVFKDKLSTSKVKSLQQKYQLNIDSSKPWYASLSVACELFERSRNEQKSILLFIHGYNNDIEDIISTALQIEAEHEVIVVPFSWPANGGGTISGTLSYQSDKADARASEGALNRVVGKFQFYHNLLISGRRDILQKKANSRHPDNPQQAKILFSTLVNKQCSTTLNLLCHSMGNYVLKKSLMNGSNQTSKLVFDNVCLVAADANNLDHKQWVEKIDVRNRVYIVINENDFALKASRIKPGDEQLARLGHYIKRLDSSNSNYIDLTHFENIANKHTYFVGVTSKNDSIQRLFTKMFNGQCVEPLLRYQTDNNIYRLID